MEIPKDQILQLLRDRGEHDKADQAEQQLPDQVDPDQHGDLLGKTRDRPERPARRHRRKVRPMSVTASDN